MPKLLSLSRAARLAGVSRGELQQRIRSRGVETFEGEIRVDTLLDLYPAVDLDRDPVLERLQHIKATAQPKTRYTDGLLPEPEVLVSRLHELNRILVRTKASLNEAERLIESIRDRLDSGIDSGLAEAIRQLIDAGQNHREAPDDRDAQLFAKNVFLKVMAASVKVRPSGHEFFVDGNESILQAGLKAGLHLDYGCSSGNCGACKARVVSGEVQKIKDHDFVLGERELQQGQILSCCWTAVTDVELEAAEAHDVSDLPQQQIRTRVAKVEPLSETSAILHLRTPRTQTLRFMAGQQARLSDEEGNSGEFPISSCPCDGRNLEFIISAEEDGAFTRSVLQRRIKGQVVLLDGPHGDFVLREDARRPAVFVAFGNGFAPVKSLVEQAISVDTLDHLHLYRVDDPLTRNRLDNLCRAWTDSLDNFSFTLLEPGTQASDLVRRIVEDVGGNRGYDLYVAGPSAETAAFVQAAEQAGIERDSIRTGNR